VCNLFLSRLERRKENSVTIQHSLKSPVLLVRLRWTVVANRA
jgi:hypothetical protein